MKNTTTIKIAISLAFISFQNLYAQQVCLVSADYQNGENYMVVWEKPFDLTGLDSVFIYRKQGVESVFTKVGAQDINALSYYKDLTSNTMDTTKYAITFLDNVGNESALSPWHQGVVLDYFSGGSGGDIIWTKYKKQNQTDESYIYGYDCMMDQSNFGAYTSMGYFMNYQTSWFDQAALSNPMTTYYIETHLPSCYMSKANINTSRSNIKKQFSNDEAGINETGITTGISISPNPASQVLNITFDEKLVGGFYTINDASGKVIFNGSVTSTKLSIDLGEIQNGTYFINIDKKGSVVTKIFMKN